ncbi:peptidylprolyl isomerase [Salinisphaera sp. Q1T1-3]|uniref:peptidylprolyl isomerase n=1 Tax=Salinisphaera sp. Q1T1-3 TaxID=2321229 RepID=UPI000E73D148|nr:peptidylprolyl isomerase [Salinisphaera sp. Q1T1-3]RJS95036.1 peptidyl-prolyl cis-trans isomerase [Salinisphaera sp. Q1T1-3]
MVIFTTNLGDIHIEVDETNAPVSAENFLTYVRDGFYDGVIFHRVIPGFVVQGGGFDTDFNQQKTRAPIKNESANGLENKRGTLSMARTQDPHSATSQFFINLRDNEQLDDMGYRPGYAVFARVVEGMDIVDAIAEVSTGAAGPFGQDVPQETVQIESARIV